MIRKTSDQLKVALISDENKRFYFNKLQDKEEETFFSEVAKRKGDIFILRRGAEKEKVEHYSIVFVNEKKIMMERTGLILKFARSKSEGKNVIVKIPLDEELYLSSSVLNFDKNTRLYNIKISDDIYQAVRRKDYRLMANKDLIMKLKINNEEYDCNDVSAGGASMTLDKDSSLNKGEIFSKVHLLISDTSYIIPKIKIVAVKEESETKITLGLAFLDVPYDIDEKLSLQINSEAREYEILKTLASSEKAC